MTSSTSPFTEHVGIDVRPSAPGIGAVRLCEGEHLNNHVGSRHAGALFAAGDAAGTALIEATFPPAFARVVWPASERISYERMAKGPVSAAARLGDVPFEGDPVTAVATGRVRKFDVEVEMTDDQGATVARMTIVYSVEGPPPALVSTNGHGPTHRSGS